MLLKVLQNLQESTSARVSFLKGKETSLPNNDYLHIRVQRSNFSKTFLDFTPTLFLIILKRLYINSGIKEQVTGCGEHGEWGECYIPGNGAKQSGECRQTFRVMLPKIPENVLKDLAECCQIFRKMRPNIPESVLRYSAECLCHLRGWGRTVSPRFHGICSTEYSMEFVAVDW